MLFRSAANDAEPQEAAVRDGTHGLVVWALSALLGAMIAAGGISAIGKTGGELAKSGVMAATGIVGAASDYAVDDLTRNQVAGTPLDADTRAQIGRIILRAGSDGQLSTSDRAYLVRTLATSASITPAEAETRIVTMLAQANAAIEKAKLAAEKARRSAILIAFLTAASLAIAAAASWWAATLGGKHRDENTDFAQIFRW